MQRVREQVVQVLADRGVRPTHVTSRDRERWRAALLDGKACLVGGMGPGFKPTAVDDVLDLATGVWSTIPQPAVRRLGARLVPLADGLLLVGGTAVERGGACDLLELFTPATGTWRTLGRLRGAPTNLQAVARGNTVILFAVSVADPAAASVSVLHLPLQ